MKVRLRRALVISLLLAIMPSLVIASTAHASDIYINVQSDDPHTGYLSTFNVCVDGGNLDSYTHWFTSRWITNNHPGEVFIGWKIDGTGTLFPDLSSCSNFPDRSNIFAQWTQTPTFTVTFDPNGGEGSMDPQIAAGNNDLASVAFLRSFYDFAGWNTAADGSGTSYDDEETYSFASDITLYAQWVPVFTVTFDGNGGSANNMWSQTSSSSDRLRINSFTRNGYQFVGWNTAADGSGSAYANREMYDFSADITLHAQWSSTSSSSTVTFIDVISTGMRQQTASGSTALRSNTFTRNGYTFSGWTSNADGSGTSYADGETYSFASGMTVYAKWTIASSDSDQGESDAATVAAAAVKEVEEARARAVTEAKSEVKSVLTAGKPLTAEQLAKADFVGVTLKNIDFVNADIAKLPESERTDIKQIEKVVLKFATVDKVAEGKSYYSSDLIAVGLIPQDSKIKSLILASLKKLPQSSLDSFEKIQQAIASVEKVAADRKARLTALLSRRR